MPAFLYDLCCMISLYQPSFMTSYCLISWLFYHPLIFSLMFVGGFPNHLIFLIFHCFVFLNQLNQRHFLDILSSVSSFQICQIRGFSFDIMFSVSSFQICQIRVASLTSCGQFSFSKATESQDVQFRFPKSAYSDPLIRDLPKSADLNQSCSFIFSDQLIPISLIHSWAQLT